MKLSHKVVGGAIAGALVTILTWILYEFAHIDIPNEIAAALVVIVTAVTGYLIKEPQPTT